MKIITIPVNIFVYFALEFESTVHEVFLNLYKPRYEWNDSFHHANNQYYQAKKIKYLNENFYKVLFCNCEAV